MKNSRDSIIKNVFFVLLVCFTSLAYGQEPEERWLIVTWEGNLYKRIEVTDWEPGEDFFNIGHYLYPWNGEDSIDWREEDRVLWVNGIPVGSSSGAGLSSFQDKSTFVTALGTADDEFLKTLPDLTCYTVLFTYGYPLSMPDFLGSEKLLEWYNTRKFRYLKRFKNLKALNLGVSLSVNDRVTKYLKDLENLRYLDLSMSGVTDEGLSNISGLTSMRVLILRFSNITDVGLGYITDMDNLRILDLSNTSITDDCLIYLTRFQYIREINLRGTKISAEGLRKLDGMISLKRLEISERIFSDEVRRWFEVNLPGCEVCQN